VIAIDLNGKRALVAGVGDERGFGFAIAPLPTAITADEVTAAAAFLSSPLARGITGTVLHVDHGYAVMGVGADPPSPRQPTHDRR
jgi:enoyl-[acyl-carrier-protein] reductase (NADH)